MRDPCFSAAFLEPGHQLPGGYEQEADHADLRNPREERAFVPTADLKLGINRRLGAPGGISTMHRHGATEMLALPRIQRS